MTESLKDRLTSYLRQADGEDVRVMLRLVAEEAHRRGKRHYTLADISDGEEQP